MDFTKFDARGKAETGKAFPILHPETLTPLVEDGKTAMFIVRGNAAPSVQEAQQRALVEALKNAEKEDVSSFTFEDMHQKSIKAAMLLLVGFENVELNGKPVTMENAEEFLNLVFPRVVKDDANNGRLKIANKPFPMQVIERANELDELLGNV